MGAASSPFPITEKPTMTNQVPGLTRRHRRSHRPGMMSLVSSCNFFGQARQPPLARWQTTLPAAARAPSATAGYRGESRTGGADTASISIRCVGIAFRTTKNGPPGGGPSLDNRTV